MDALGDNLMQGRCVCLVNGRHQLHGWLEAKRRYCLGPTSLAGLNLGGRLGHHLYHDGGRGRGSLDCTLGLKGCLGLGATGSALLTLAPQVLLLTLRWRHAALGLYGCLTLGLETVLLGLVGGCLSSNPLGLGDVARLVLLGELGQQFCLDLTHAPSLVLNLSLAPLLFAALHHLTLGRGQALMTSQSLLVHQCVVRAEATAARVRGALLAGVVDALEHALARLKLRHDGCRAVRLGDVDDQLLALELRHRRGSVHG